jgi:hypothetical protein
VWTQWLAKSKLGSDTQTGVSSCLAQREQIQHISRYANKFNLQNQPNLKKGLSSNTTNKTANWRRIFKESGETQRTYERGVSVIYIIYSSAQPLMILPLPLPPAPPGRLICSAKKRQIDSTTYILIIVMNLGTVATRYPDS